MCTPAPLKPKSSPLYCYIGCGVDRQPSCITSMVVRTNDPALTAAVATACRILGLSFPGNKPVEVTEDRIDADAEMQTTLEDLLSRIGNMWVPWADLATQPNQMLDRLLHQFWSAPLVWQPGGPAQPTESIAPRVLELVAPPEDEPEWDCDVDVDVLPEVQVLVPINDLPQAPPARQRIRIGVDIGGVLFGSEPKSCAQYYSDCGASSPDGCGRREGVVRGVRGALRGK